MNAKLVQLRRMLDDGYQIEEIHTEDRQMEAVLVRQGSRAILRLDRQSAEDLLFRDAWRSRRAKVWIRR